MTRDPTPALRATVLIPTTGERGRLLEMSVDSVLRQSIGDIEVFVIGDGAGEAARATVARLMQRDPRVRFFDHPKHPRRGEPYRHAALAEARGEIVCYLTDRDLMMPDHVAVMAGMLADVDFAQTLRFAIMPDGSIGFPHVTVDVAHPQDRAAISQGHFAPPLSFGAHTLAAYRRLPHGWRTTPPGIYTDNYMAWQFFDQPDCRAAVSTRPTILYFKRGDHPGMPTEERAAELAVWHARLLTPGWAESFAETVRDAAIRDRARIPERVPLADVLRRDYPGLTAALRRFPPLKALAKLVVRDGL